MLKFLNNLMQLKSFKVLSVLGYIVILLWLYMYFGIALEYIGIFIHGMKTAGLNLIYIISFIILFIIGFWEYKQRKNNFIDENIDFTFFIFYFGLIFPPCFLFIFLCLLHDIP